MTVYVITHPEVAVDPTVPVPQWGLSDAGRDRVAALLRMPWAGGLTRVVSSAERKARETAAALAHGCRVPVIIDPELGENDRSATGFLPPAEFEATADRFFAEPTVSVRGWETAAAAQARMLAAVGRALAGATHDVGVVCHGGVGTLLLCRLLGEPISRSRDQPGQGSWYSFDPATGAVHQTWQRIG